MPWQQRRPPAGRTPQKRSADPAGARARALALLTGRGLRFGGAVRKTVRPLYPRGRRRDGGRPGGGGAGGRPALRRGPRPAACGGRAKAAWRQPWPCGARGLTDGQIDAALEAAYAPGEAGEDPELEAARALVAGPYRAKLAAGRRDLVAAALARRGFPHRVIRQALDAPDGEEA